MVRLKPFQPLRPPVTLASEVSASAFEKPVYGQYPSIAPTKDFSYKRILNPGQFESRALNQKEVYQKAEENLREFLEKQYLIRENDPAFYVYQQSTGKHSFTGIIGTYALCDYEAGNIRKHELTHKGKEEAIANYFLNVGVNGSPVMLTFPADQAIDKMINGAKHTPPLFNFTTKDGIHHSVWRLSNGDEIGQIQNAFKAIPTLYIADGHHRCAAYEHYAAKKQLDSGMAFFIPDNEIHIYGYHRLLKGMNGWTLESLLRKFGEHFQVAPLYEERFPKEPGELVFIAHGQWYVLKPLSNLYHPESFKANLDVYLLEQYLLEPYFGIDNDRQEDQIRFVEGIIGLGQLKQIMTNETMHVAFLLHPIPINYLMKLADNAETLPPKSTWIEPKLRSGLTVHELQNFDNKFA